jgi:hypothetical protein
MFIPALTSTTIFWKCHLHFVVIVFVLITDFMAHVLPLEASRKMSWFCGIQRLISVQQNSLNLAFGYVNP